MQEQGQLLYEVVETHLLLICCTLLFGILCLSYKVVSAPLSYSYSHNVHVLTFAGQSDVVYMSVYCVQMKMQRVH